VPESSRSRGRFSVRNVAVIAASRRESLPSPDRRAGAGQGFGSARFRRGCACWAAERAIRLSSGDARIEPASPMPSTEEATRSHRTN
jgi:hypothetical protein